MPISKKKVVPTSGASMGKEILVDKYYYTKNDECVAVIMGCFSPFTGKGGHGRMLETAKQNGIDKFVLAIVPKKERLDSDRNMFTIEQKKEIAEKAIKEMGYNLVDSFIAKKNFPYSILKEVAIRNPKNRVVLVCGPDREEDYKKFCNPFNRLNEQEQNLEKDNFEYILNDPGKDEIRATAVRKAIFNNDKDMFISMTGYNENMWNYIYDLAKKNGVLEEPKDNGKNIRIIEEYVRSIKNPNTDKPNQLFYVGGCVRDEYMGIESHDYDLLTTMEGKLFENAPIWDKADHMFRPNKVVILGTMNGITYEVNAIMPNVDEPKGLYENLYSRDITINSIAKDVTTNEVYDPMNGISDIKNKIIRATPFTLEKFNNGKEPVRVIRILRFLGYFGNDWKLDEQTKESMLNFSRVNKGKCKIPPNQFELNWNKIKYNKDKIIDLIKELGFDEYFKKTYECYEG